MDNLALLIAYIHKLNGDFDITDKQRDYMLNLIDLIIHEYESKDCTGRDRNV